MDSDREAIFNRVTRADGTSEVEDFLDSLPVKDRAKLEAIIDSVECFGMVEAYKQQWVKKVRDDICEVRSRKGSNIQRVLFFQEVDNRYIFTHGFTKKTDKTPEQEIEHAKNMMEKFLKEI